MSYEEHKHTHITAQQLPQTMLS